MGRSQSFVLVNRLPRPRRGWEQPGAVPTCSLSKHRPSLPPEEQPFDKLRASGGRKV